MLYFRHFCYLFHKLSKEKLRINEQMPIYAFYVLLHPIVQEIASQNLNRTKKHEEIAKASSPHRAGSEEEASQVREHHFHDFQGSPHRARGGPS